MPYLVSSLIDVDAVEIKRLYAILDVQIKSVGIGSTLVAKQYHFIEQVETPLVVCLFILTARNQIQTSYHWEVVALM